MIAVFQLPDKFFHRDGGAADMLGQDWERTWNAAAAVE
jgi:hypothetical protein